MPAHPLSSSARHSLRIDTPIGPLSLLSDGAALLAVFFDRHAGAPDHNLRELGPDEITHTAAAQLEEFFARQRRDFELPLRAEGTAFQRAVWTALHTIPFGETITYAELALRVGRPKAARAVGAANGKNPLSILVPCHRVIGANGALTGYAGGVENKRKLLEFERA